MKKIALASVVVLSLGLADIGISQVQAGGSFGFYIGSGLQHGRHYVRRHGRRYGGHYDWHHTSRYGWRPGGYVRYHDHFDYYPGYWDWHSTGHYDYPRGRRRCYRSW